MKTLKPFKQTTSAPRRIPILGLAFVLLIPVGAGAQGLTGLVDGDGDRFPDALEAKLCGTKISADALAAAGVGRCASSKNYVPPRDIHLATVPTGVVLGPDNDHDAFPQSVSLTGINLYINPFESGAWIVRTSEAKDTTVSLGPIEDDNDKQKPVVSTIKVDRALPLDVVLGKDADVDGLPATVTLKMAYLTVDRSSGHALVSFEAADPKEDVVVPIDTKDNDPQEPVMSMVTAHVPVWIWHTGDGDNDLLPGALVVTFMDVTIDRRRSLDNASGPTVKLADHEERTTLDKDDDRDSHIPFSHVDADVDFLPDAAEPYICMVQDVNTDADGKCVSKDGSGPDGSGDNFVAPVGVVNPWSLHAAR